MSKCLSKRLVFTRTMSTLVDIPKHSTFTKNLEPDSTISSHEIALENKDDIIHRPRVLRLGNFSWTLPQERKDYRYLTSSPIALRDLGLDENEPQNPAYRKIVSGEYYLENKDTFLKQGFPFPYSQAYAGWQFGQFAGQLGDGRVANLFEIQKQNPDGKNRPYYELQLKGSGKTPYSRFADGKAVIRSSIREYIISEHLNAIGIPTTRALSLTYLPTTLAQRHRAEKCAIVSRFAELWIRLGTFDLHRWRSDRDGIRKLSDYVIENLFTINGDEFANFNKIVSLKPKLLEKSKGAIGKLTPYDKMYFETIIRNALTTAIWQSYGFLNGVLNTDNTSVLGLSMDFGPFSIMDKYDPNYSPNSEDHELRYSYRNTPTSIWWNLTRMGENLAELIGAGDELIDDTFFKSEGIKKEWEDKIIKRATVVIETGGELYQYAFLIKYLETIFNRLGISLKLLDYEDPDKQNEQLLVPMFEMLHKFQCDFNKFFLILQNEEVTESNYDSIADKIISIEDEETSRYSKKELKEEVRAWLPIYKSYIEQSGSVPGYQRSDSRKHNPSFLPRNWILDEVITKVEESDGQDLSYLNKLEKMSFYPYDRSKWGDDLKDLEDKWILQGDIGNELSMLQCSCSS